jgi:protein required for attachment to host cells
MMSGRTSRGTPIRSTLGMRNEKVHRYWALVADRTRACLFERVAGLVDNEYVLRQETLNPDGRAKGHELLSDRPGRSFDSRDSTRHGQAGGTRHSYGNTEDPKHSAAEDLVRAVGVLVDKAKLNVAGTKLTIVAEPKLMGMLRSLLEKRLTQVELQYLVKDFAWLNEPQIGERLTSLLGS